MAPAARQLEEALIASAINLFRVDPDNVTVNKVRSAAAESLSLDEDYFTSATWKTKSKNMIKGYVVDLHDGKIPKPHEPKDTKVGVKRKSSEETSPAPKRRKPASKAQKQESDVELSEEDVPKKKARGRGRVKVADSDDEEDAPPAKKRNARAKVKPLTSDDEDDTPKKTIAKREKSAVLDTIEDSKRFKASSSTPDRKRKIEPDNGPLDVMDTTAFESPDSKETAKRENGSSQSPDRKKKTKAEHGPLDVINTSAFEGPDRKKTPKSEHGPLDVINTAAFESPDEDVAKRESTPPKVEEEEEYSDVIDEAPKPKRAKKEKVEKKDKVEKKVKKESTAAAKRAASPDDPDEAEIKKLQSHLVKCGVRKLWHNELKEHGSDARAKIRHLKKMLSDIGMEGRFSEAKAREIKESRELLADVEEAQKMNELWGMASEGRASRSKAQNNVKAGESEDDVDVKNELDGHADDSDEKTTFAARKRRAQADLAFLGDDSESD